MPHRWVVNDVITETSRFVDRERGAAELQAKRHDPDGEAEPAIPCIRIGDGSLAADVDGR
jgi:hypothetical protein